MPLRGSGESPGPPQQSAPAGIDGHWRIRDDRVEESGLATIVWLIASRDASIPSLM